MPSLRRTHRPAGGPLDHRRSAPPRRPARSGGPAAFAQAPRRRPGWDTQRRAGWSRRLGLSQRDRAATQDGVLAHLMPRRRRGNDDREGDRSGRTVGLDGVPRCPRGARRIAPTPRAPIARPSSQFLDVARGPAGEAELSHGSGRRAAALRAYLAELDGRGLLARARSRAASPRCARSIDSRAARAGCRATPGRRS